MKKIFNIGYWTVFTFYLLLIFNIVFFARDSMRSVNLVPFAMIIEQGFNVNVWGNVLMFIPLGIYFTNSMKQYRFRTILTSIIGSSLAIEVIQFAFKRGASDIDDVLLNTIGGLLGVLIYHMLRALLTSKERVNIAISTLSLIVGLPVMFLTITLFLYNF